MKALERFLRDYLGRQLENTFPDREPLDREGLGECIAKSLASLKVCFAHVNDKYFRGGEFEDVFDHLNGNHHAMFLYRVSHEAYVSIGNERLASRIFNLNRVLHGVDIFYKVRLPEIFLLVHPLGTVLGNAEYSPFFCAYQGCTVGSKGANDGIYPRFSSKTILCSNVSVIGNCNVGSGVVFGSGASIIDTDVADNQRVLGRYPDNKLHTIGEDIVRDYFHY